MARLGHAFYDTPTLLAWLGAALPAGIAGGEQVRTGVLNAFEMTHACLRQGSEPLAREAYQRIEPLLEPLTRERIFEASRLRVRYHARGLSYTDAMGYVTARELGAVFVTSDRGFKGLPGVKLIDAMPRRGPSRETEE